MRELLVDERDLADAVAAASREQLAQVDASSSRSQSTRFSRPRANSPWMPSMTRPKIDSGREHVNVPSAARRSGEVNTSSVGMLTETMSPKGD